MLGVKNLAWGFAMAPHRLRVLVLFKLEKKPLWESVIVLCFVARYFMSILVLHSS